MKSIKSLREQVRPIEALQLAEVAGGGADLPVILIAKRKAIRQFPDGQVVGLYYSKQIDRFITIPHTVIGLSESTVTKKTNVIDDILIKFQAGKIKKAEAGKLLKQVGVLNPNPLLRENLDEIAPAVAGAVRVASTLAKSKTGRKVGKAVAGAALKKLTKDAGENTASTQAQQTNNSSLKNRVKTGVKKVADKTLGTKTTASKWQAGDVAGKLGRKVGLALTRSRETNKKNYLIAREDFEINKLRKITEDESITTYKLNSGDVVDIDYPTASAILEVHDQLNETNRYVMLEQLQTLDGFNKIKDFALDR